MAPRMISKGPAQKAVPSVAGGPTKRKRVVAIPQRDGSVKKFEAGEPGKKGYLKFQLMYNTINGAPYSSDNSEYAALRRPQSFAWGVR